MSDRSITLASISSAMANSTMQASSFAPEGDYCTKGTSREMLEELTKMRKELMENKGKIENLETRMAEQERSHQGKTARLERRMAEQERSHKEKIEQLSKKFETIQRENISLKEKVRKCEKVIENLKIKLTKEQNEKAEVLIENKELKKLLKDSGVKKINWWKVAFIALAFGILGGAVGAGIAVLGVGCATLGLGTGIGAGVGGVVGVAAGGIGAYLLENNYVRDVSSKKSN